jgi:hypothetical protein
MEIPKLIEFNGKSYRLMGTRKYYLSQSNTTEGRKRPKGLHVAIWEFNSGKEVPPGYEINHIDHDTFNNDFSNLECLPMREHRCLPKNIDIIAVRANLERIRPLATLWHRSDSGRRWHSLNSRKQWKNPNKFNCVCVQCGRDFESFHRDSTLCSGACEQKRGRESGRWSVKKPCLICEKLFSSNKYIKQLTCSRSCGFRLGRRRKKAGLQPLR